MEFEKREKKKVLIDLDGTVYDSHEPWHQSVTKAIEVLREHGLRMNVSLAMHDYTEIYTKSPNEHGVKHLKLLVKQSKRFFEDPKQSKKALAAAQDAFKQVQNDPAVFKPHPDAVKFFEALKEEDVEYYIVTNGKFSNQWDKIKRLGLSEYIDKRQVICTGGRFWRSVVNGVLQTREKNESFYRKVLKKLKIKPDQAIMVGDSEKNDVIPAKNVGIRTVRLKVGKYANEVTQAHHEANNLGQAYVHIHEFLHG